MQNLEEHKIFTQKLLIVFLKGTKTNPRLKNQITKDRILWFNGRERLHTHAICPSQQIDREINYKPRNKNHKPTILLTDNK